MASNFQLQEKRLIVSIGILAKDEEKRIGSAIHSLFRQSAFTTNGSALPVQHWELIVVPNGCSDATDTAAAHAIADAPFLAAGREVQARVISLSTPGKSNAWNHFIHEFSRRDADIFVMMDSDIDLGHPDTLANCLKELVQNAKADVVVDLPLKSITKKSARGPIETASITLSEQRFQRSPAIAGSFYCARAAVLRQIWMPPGLSAEDGFLRAMVVTNLFRSDVDDDKVVRAQNASHYYEAPASVSQIFRHELRLVIGTALNCYLTWDFLKFATDPAGPGAGVLIKQQLDKDSKWYESYIRNAIASRGWWVLPRGFLFRRFSDLRRASGVTKLKYLALACAAFLFDLCVFYAANKRIKRGRAIGFW